LNLFAKSRWQRICKTLLSAASRASPNDAPSRTAFGATLAPQENSMISSEQRAGITALGRRAG
jgi:hypothetical protein